MSEIEAGSDTIRLKKGDIIEATIGVLVANELADEKTAIATAEAIFGALTSRYYEILALKYKMQAASERMKNEAIELLSVNALFDKCQRSSPREESK